MIKARQRQRDRVWVVGPSARQRGLSLVELMIAMALGVTLVGAIAALALNTTRTYRHLSQAGEQIENGRYAMMILKENIEHAGFWGVFSPYAAKIALPESRPDPCNQTPENLAGSLLLPVVGWTCPDDLVDQVPGTSALVVRRAEAPTTNLAMDAPAIPATLNTSSTYIQVTPGEYVIGHGCSKSGLTSVDCTSGWGLQGETKNFSLTKPLNRDRKSVV